MKQLLEIGPLEMEVIGLLSASGAENSVAEVREALRKNGRELAYTTVMTVLMRLAGKGQISRRKVGRKYLYAASSKKVFAHLRETLFGNERLKPILNLLEGDLSKAELELLKKIIDEKLRR